MRSIVAFIYLQPLNAMGVKFIWIFHYFYKPLVGIYNNNMIIS